MYKHPELDVPEREIEREVLSPPETEDTGASVRETMIGLLILATQSI